VTRAEMDAQLGRLIVLKGMPGDTDDYFGALSDIPEEVFTGAISHALKTRTWFPVPAELRADCDAVTSRVRSSVLAFAPAPVVEELPAGRMVEIKNPFGGPSIRLTVTRDWKHDCAECADTGWASRWCAEKLPKQEYSICGRRFDHAPHEYVERCHCIEWNPTIRRRKEAQMKFATEPAKA
jgi:hypothetical protein